MGTLYELTDDLLQLRGAQLPEFRELDAVGVPQEKLSSEGLLQIMDMAAEHGLGDIEKICRLLF